MPVHKIVVNVLRECRRENRLSARLLPVQHETVSARVLPVRRRLAVPERRRRARLQVLELERLFPVQIWSLRSALCTLQRGSELRAGRRRARQSLRSAFYTFTSFQSLALDLLSICTKLLFPLFRCQNSFIKPLKFLGWVSYFRPLFQILLKFHKMTYHFKPVILRKY